MLVTSKVKVSHISVVLQHLHLEDSFVAEFSFFTGFLILCPPQYCSPPCNHRLRRMRLHPQKQHPQSPSVSVNNCVSVFSLLAAEIMANRLTTQSKTQQAIYIIIFFFFFPQSWGSEWNSDNTARGKFVCESPTAASLCLCHSLLDVMRLLFYLQWCRYFNFHWVQPAAVHDDSCSNVHMSIQTKEKRHDELHANWRLLCNLNQREGNDISLYLC